MVGYILIEEFMSFKNLKGKATDKQKEYLTKLGVEFASDISKQDASNLITKNRNAANKEYVYGLLNVLPGHIEYDVGGLPSMIDDGNGNVWYEDDDFYDCWW